MQNETNTIEDLFSKTTDYLETKVDLMKLKATVKASTMASSLISRFVIGIIAVIVIVFLNLGIAIWLGHIFGQLFLGFFAVTGFYLLVLIILFSARKQLMEFPVRDSIIKNFFN